MVYDICERGAVMDMSLTNIVPFDESTARNYFCQLLLGIEYLHENDIVHRGLLTIH